MSVTIARYRGREDRAQFGRDWEDWHRAHEARRADPHGFLAVTGLHWLARRAAASFEGLPGAWSTGPDGPVVDLARRRVALTVAGEAVTGRHAFGVIAERGGVTVGFEGGVIEVAKRGGHDILRPRRADHPFLATYGGTPTYVPNPRWRVRARFVAYDAPRPTEVGAAVDGLTHVYDAPGELEFTLQGEEFRLVAFPGHGDGDLLVLFTDATSGLTTYAANRSLSAARARRGRLDGARLQPRRQPPVRVHGLRDLPAAAGREPPPDRHRGGREDAAGAGAGAMPWSGAPA